MANNNEVDESATERYDARSYENRRLDGCGYYACQRVGIN